MFCFLWILIFISNLSSSPPFSPYFVCLFLPSISLYYFPCLIVLYTSSYFSFSFSLCLSSLSIFIFLFNPTTPLVFISLYLFPTLSLLVSFSLSLILCRPLFLYFSIPLYLSLCLLLSAPLSLSCVSNSLTFFSSLQLFSLSFNLLFFLFYLFYFYSFTPLSPSLSPYLSLSFKQSSLLDLIYIMRLQQLKEIINKSRCCHLRLNLQLLFLYRIFQFNLQASSQNVAVKINVIKYN